MLLCPVESDPAVRLTQGFGLNPATYAQFDLKGHNGNDYTGPVPGQPVPIYSAMDCVVTEVGDEGTHGYGRFVRTRSLAPNAQGRFRECVYGHLKAHTVKKGDVIPLGDPFATMGNTGFSTGLHLHWGLRFLDKSFNVIDYGNGFKGYVDQFPWTVFWRKRGSGLLVLV